jgi:hypothetical protein
VDVERQMATVPPMNRLVIALSCLVATSALADDKAAELVAAMQKKTGTMQDLHALKDVEYTYTYRSGATGKLDLSVERYRFDGELSYGRYVVHEVFVSPDLKGEVIHAYDGEQYYATIDGRPLEDPEVMALVRFGRPTNYYWFTMMQKLTDPGTVHEYQGTRIVDGVTYDLVQLTFESKNDRPTDRYVLYFNRSTQLIDRFLFTVIDFGKTDPYMMEVEYDRFGKLLLPTYRRYAPSNWSGEIKKDEWNEEIMTGLHFDNGFTKADFRP